MGMGSWEMECFLTPLGTCPDRAQWWGHAWLRDSWLRLPSGGGVGAGLPVPSEEEAAGWAGGVSGRSGHKVLEVRVGVSRKEAGHVGRDQVLEEGLEPTGGLR